VADAAPNPQPTTGSSSPVERVDLPPTFPEPLVRGEPIGDYAYAVKLRDFATRWVLYFIDYYDKRAWRCRVGVTLIRGVAFSAMVLGGVILVGRMLGRDAQEFVMGLLSSKTPPLKEVPAEGGLILFALAAGLMAADRYGNISSNWMRYVITSLSLRRMLIDFQMGGVAAERLVMGTNVETAQPEYDRIKSFLAAVFDLVRQETQEWADEFRKNRSELEAYLKVQDAANKANNKPPPTKPERQPPPRRPLRNGQGRGNVNG
jgi:SMODS and SLOG-associating 2TM effector domain 2